MSVRISLDEKSKQRLDRQFDRLMEGANKSAYRALMKIAFKIKTEAQMRLTGRGHIVTSRLKNSIFVKSKNKTAQPTTYTDDKGKSYSAELTTVEVGINEVAIGTNVIYANRIEVLDSYLYWALKNVDVMQSVKQDMQEDMKTGKFARD